MCPEPVSNCRPEELSAEAIIGYDTSLRVQRGHTPYRPLDADIRRGLELAFLRWILVLWSTDMLEIGGQKFYVSYRRTTENRLVHCSQSSHCYWTIGIDRQRGVSADTPQDI